MQLHQLLAVNRIAVWPSPREVSSAFSSFCPAKGHALEALAYLLSLDTQIRPAQIEQVLHDREEMQSTAIGDGIAVPHGALQGLDTPRGALLVIPNGAPLDAIDGEDVYILFAVVRPLHATVGHLKMLARISKVLGKESLRERILRSTNPVDILSWIDKEERQETGWAPHFPSPLLSHTLRPREVSLLAVAS